MINTDTDSEPIDLCVKCPNQSVFIGSNYIGASGNLTLLGIPNSTSYDIFFGAINSAVDCSFINSSQNNISTENFSSYPNPFSNQFTLQLKSISNISIYNLFGEKLIDIKNASGTVTLGKELSSGIYILEIKNESGETAVRKIVKVE